MGAAKISMDEATGAVRVERYVPVADVGRAMAGAQVAGHVAKAQDAVHRGDVERAVVEGDAARLVQPAGHDVHPVRLVVAVPVDRRVDLARRSQADEHDPFRARRHLTGVRYVGAVGGADCRRHDDGPRSTRDACGLTAPSSAAVTGRRVIQEVRGSRPLVTPLEFTLGPGFFRSRC